MTIFRHKRIIFLIGILVISTLIVTTISISLIYRQAVNTLKISLTSMVEREKIRIEVLYQNNKDENKIIDFFKQIRERNGEISETGEFAIARKSNDSIEFIISSIPANKNLKLLYNAHSAIPMKLALSGKSGFIKDHDYNNIQVFAAYSYIPELGWGIVAKISTQEIITPYINASIIAFIIAIFLITFCAFLFLKVTNPLINGIIESEKKFSLLFDSSADAVFIHDLNGNFWEVNQTACKRLKYTKHEFKKLNVCNIDTPIHAALLQEKTRKILENNEIFFETEHITKNGEIIPTEINAKIIEYKGNKAVISVARDITQRKIAENKLKESEENYRLLFENMSNGFALHEMIYDKNKIPIDYRFITINPAFEKLTGLNSSITNKRVLEVLPHTEKIWIENYGQVALSGKSRQFEDYSQDLDKYYSVIAFCPKSDFFAVIITDITQRKKDELLIIENQKALKIQNDEYQALNEEYVAINEELKINNELLQKAKEKAEESDRLKSAFLANMSHEIRTPMNGILGFSKLLTKPNLSIEKQNKFFELINNCGNQLMTIIDDLIDISKVEANLIKIEEKPIILNNLLSDIYHLFNVKSEKPDINFSFSKALSDLESNVLTDNSRIRQILTNLIGNAFKFTQKGSIDFGYILKNSEIEFFVKDTGIGISK